MSDIIGQSIGSCIGVMAGGLILWIKEYISDRIRLEFYLESRSESEKSTLFTLTIYNRSRSQPFFLRQIKTFTNKPLKIIRFENCIPPGSSQSIELEEVKHYMTGGKISEGDIGRLDKDLDPKIQFKRLFYSSYQPKTLKIYPVTRIEVCDRTGKQWNVPNSIIDAANDSIATKMHDWSPLPGCRNCQEYRLEDKKFQKDIERQFGQLKSKCDNYRENILTTGKLDETGKRLRRDNISEENHEIANILAEMSAKSDRELRKNILSEIYKTFEIGTDFAYFWGIKHHLLVSVKDSYPKIMLKRLY